MLIGVGAMVAIMIYNYVVSAAERDPQHSLNTNGILWVRVALVPIVALLLIACVVKFSGALLVQAVMFGLLLVASFVHKAEPPAGGAE